MTAAAPSPKLVGMASMMRPHYTRNGKKFQTANWYVSWRDDEGNTRRESLGTPDEESARKLFGDWLKRHHLEKAGILPKQSKEASRPIASHLADFIGIQEGKVSVDHAKRIDSRLKTILTKTGWRQLADMEPNGLERALADLVADGLSPSTINAYLVHARHFANWLADRGRIPSSPFRVVKRRSTKGKEERNRRALSDDEARRLLDATQCGQPWRHFSGTDRFWMYALAMGTGLRADEVASLRKNRFDWELRIVRVPGPGTKNKEEALQPIPAELADGLRAYVGARPGDVIWPRMDRTAEMLRVDLAAAKIEPIDEEGRHVDFHALRHTYCTRLARANPPVHPSTAQKLMRHSDIKLTLSYYTHTDAVSRVSAVDSLAPLLAPKTGRRRQTVAEDVQAKGKTKPQKKREKSKKPRKKGP